MDYTMHFLIGFFVSFVGSITPSMLNMTALKTRLKNGVNSGYHYILGVSVVVLLQASIAVFLSKYIIDNPTVLEAIEQLGVFVFILLAIYFYKESKKEKTPHTAEKPLKSNFFLRGLILSFLNMFSIPFFCGVVAFLDVFNWFSFDVFSTISFILGSGIGTLAILFFYVKYAYKIQEKTGKLTTDINFVLSFLTAFAALISILKMGYKFITI